jgi:hypothetical protein
VLSKFWSQLQALLVQAGINGGNADQEQLLRDYAHLSGSVIQLAAYMMAEPAQASASIESDENFDKSNQSASVLLSPRAAALALKHGSVGMHHKVLHTCTLHCPGAC